jgi:hypothetical protein
MGPQNRRSGVQELIAEYGVLRNSHESAAQRRGQAFNELIAAMLRMWGVGANSSMRGAGGRDEIDVVFAVNETRFVLEAKWKNRPVPADPIEKLYGRIRSRARGTRGIFLSMSGYTRPVRESAEHNKWPDILLLDNLHFEAMLCGVLPPTDLLTAVLDHASYRGGSYVSLGDLLVSRNPGPAPTLTKLPPDSPVSSVDDPARGITGRVVFSADFNWPAIYGMVSGDDQHLLIAASSGIIKVRPQTGETTWAMPFTGCNSALFIQQDRRLLTTCGSGVVYWVDGSLHVAAGGFSGNARLLLGPDDSAWVFDAEDGSLTHIGALPGDEQRHSIEYNPFDPSVYRPVWLSGSRFLFAGYRYSYIVDLDESTRLDPNLAISLPHNSPMGLCSLNETTVVAASGDYQSHITTVDLINLEGMEIELIAKVRDAAYAFDLVATKDDHLFLLLMDMGGNGQTPPVIVRLDGLRESNRIE